MSDGSVGLVGIGMMGWPMGANLVKNGCDLIVYDSDKARAERFASEVGGRAAATLADLGAEADTVITMLPNSVIVTDVVLGSGNLGAAMREGSILIEMSSGAPDATIAIAKVLSPKAVAVLDAPVSGGVSRARSGELTIMVGGDETTFERCRALLSMMGANIVRAGSLGSGQAMKALNNLVSAGGFLIGIEALLIGQKFGLDPERMVDILNTSTGMNNSTQRKFKQFVLSRKFSEGGFGIGLMAKDVGIALDIAKAGNVPVPFAAHCAQMWAAAAKMLGAQEDHTAIARMCESFADMTLGKQEAES